MGSPNTAWVLVIEDIRDQAELWSDTCANAGLNSTTAVTGVAGYRWRARYGQRSFLLDLMPPDIDYGKSAGS